MMKMICPACGAPAVSVAPETIDHMLRGTGRFSGASAAMAKAPTAVKLARLGLLAARELYKRVPGGGAKRCTACGHEFH